MPMPKKISVCVIDDDETVRASLAALLDSAGYTYSGYGTLGEFVPDLKKIKCDCVLLDVWLPDGNGLDLLSRIRDYGFDTPVIVITGHGDVPMAVKAIHLGAADFIEKPFDPDELLETIERAYDEYCEKKRSNIQRDRSKSLFEKLTPRETEVMKLLVDGQSNKKIALNLGLSPRTVEVHRARVMEKTHATSLSHLVRMAIAEGITELR